MLLETYRAGAKLAMPNVLSSLGFITDQRDASFSEMRRRPARLSIWQ